MESSAVLLPYSRDVLYVDALLEAAADQELHQDPYWHTLLHYKDGLFGFRSLVDDPVFFVAPSGKHDPRAELEATLRSFFWPAPAEGDTTTVHPVCRFPARFEWLQQTLQIDETRLPVPRCERLERMMDQILPESVTLVFPTSHVNSPASMYGHTLLTINSASGSKLLAYAVNYSALTTGTAIAPIYMAKGLLGGYPGYFSILPYYAKLQEYSDIADRDIWEYPLNLDQHEIRRMILHIAEMDEIHSNYFFFTENCSYGLMFLLEAARPGLNLTNRFGWWVIPLDTIRTIREAGLIREAIYRPSRSTKVGFLSSSLSKESRSLALEVTRGEREAGKILERDIPLEEKIGICDLASEYLQYLHAKRKLDQPTYVPRFLATLQARSTLGPAEEWRYQIPAPYRPDGGHLSSRVAIMGGALEEEPFQEIRLRPAYHAVLDNGKGYKRGLQIVFLDTVLRYYSNREKLKLEGIKLIDILSIAPRTRFMKPFSWTVKTELFRRTLEPRPNGLIYRLGGGPGLAYDPPVPGIWYLLLEADLRLGGSLERGFSLGGGPTAGVLIDPAWWWKIHLSARYRDYFWGEAVRQAMVCAEQGFSLSTNIAVSVHADFHIEKEMATHEIRAGASFFF